MKSKSVVVGIAKAAGLLATTDYVHSKGLKFGLWFGHSLYGCPVAMTPTHPKKEEESPRTMQPSMLISSLQVGSMQSSTTTVLTLQTPPIPSLPITHALLALAVLP